MSDDIYGICLTLQISVSDDCCRRVVKTSQAGGDTRVVRTNTVETSATSSMRGARGPQALWEKPLFALRLDVALLRLQLGGVGLGNGSSILSYLPSLVRASALSRDVRTTTASTCFSGDVSKEKPAVAHSRVWRKRRSMALSDDGAAEVVVDTADEPPAKQARLRERPHISDVARGIQIDPFNWRSNPYVWQREDYRCEQRRSTTLGRDPYMWR
ncbi:hypothetical protein DPMN_083224 [Dreissena polymorpha]|uniref:Uncharacterized protein n=1 Tax=Dreissena polymorpha TaxID=45954 RepID=A0A9D3Y8Y3_DREPO|nr:hypothetical protein DPMN_083224 [Dreissena polymorpha]